MNEDYNTYKCSNLQQVSYKYVYMTTDLKLGDNFYVPVSVSGSKEIALLDTGNARAVFDAS